MVEHKDRVNVVMLGVGAAFDFLAGSKRQAPRLVKTLGLEWLFRLVSEPRRLWRRYLGSPPDRIPCASSSGGYQRDLYGEPTCWRVRDRP
jgi:UDP-N-acetyl-D-mannosaminuronic acid transferase (WecB/TagA/CpsF family)